MNPDPVADHLVRELQKQDPDGRRLAQVFRQTFDQAYDGLHTGRYRPEELSKTEAAHIGSLVEINIRRELDGFITDGESMDYKIANLEVDCKYSKNPFGWMIPNETVGHYAMLCHADDRKSTWRVGFAKITLKILNAGGNRDQKRTISKLGRDAISWAWIDAELPPNTLLQLEEDEVQEIMSPRSGQQRINNLFRIARGSIIPRGVIATVAQQKDYMKRVRGNGGARTSLQPEGIVVLGGYSYHRDVAKGLGLPTPGPGDSISAQLVPGQRDDYRPTVKIDQTWWRLADPTDEVVPAPYIPNTLSNSEVEKLL